MKRIYERKKNSPLRLELQEGELPVLDKNCPETYFLNYREVPKVRKVGTLKVHRSENLSQCVKTQQVFKAHQMENVYIYIEDCRVNISFLISLLCCKLINCIQILQAHRLKPGSNAAPLLSSTFGSEEHCQM